ARRPPQAGALADGPGALAGTGSPAALAEARARLAEARAIAAPLGLELCARIDALANGLAPTAAPAPLAPPAAPADASPTVEIVRDGEPRLVRGLAARRRLPPS